MLPSPASPEPSAPPIVLAAWLMFAMRDSKCARLACAARTHSTASAGVWGTAAGGGGGNRRTSMLMSMEAGCIEGSEAMIIAYVVDVNPSISALYRELRTCIVAK